MAERSVRHHFLPRAAQKPFTIDGEKLWYSERDDEGRFSAPELRNTRSTFWLRNFYTVRSEGGPSDIVERRYYGGLDAFHGAIVPEILEILKRRQIPSFSAEQLDGLRRVVHNLIKRTPEFLKAFDDDLTIGREFAKDYEQALIQANDLHELKKFRIEMADERRIRDQGRDIRVRAGIAPSPQSEQELQDFVPRFVVSNDKGSFLLSSLGAYRIGNGGSNALVNPNMEIWMPLSPKVVLCLRRDPEGIYPPVFWDNQRHIREVNEYAADNSSAIASHSRALIERITGRKAVEPR